MHRFIEIAKSHPYLIGGGVCVAALLIFFSFRTKAATGGTYAVADQNDTTNAQINAQLVMAQDAISGQTNQAQLALEAKKDDNATALQLANGANATALAGATINAGSLIDQSKISQQTSLLQLAASTSLASQQMGLSAGLENQALEYQHFNDVYSDYAKLGVTGGSSAIEAAAVAGNSYAQAENTAFQSGPLGAGTGLNIAFGTVSPKLSSFLGMFGLGGGSSPGVGTAPTSPAATTPAAYLTGVSSVLQAIQQRVTPGDPTAVASSH